MSSHAEVDGAPVVSDDAEALDEPKVTVELGYINEPHEWNAEGWLPVTGLPGFVLPQVFHACWDDLDKYPAVVKFDVEVRLWTGPRAIRVVLEARFEEGVGHDWDDSPYEYLGELPRVPIPTLLREAVAQAAMPASNPVREEMGRHAGAVRALKMKRAPRIERWDLNQIRFFDWEARANPEITTEWERREYIFEKLHEWSPADWPRGDGRTPDYDRLKPFLAELDRERRVGETR